MNRVNIVAFLTCVVVLVGIFLYSRQVSPSMEEETLEVGFIYENDESTPYTYNFVLVQELLQKELGSQVCIHTKNNVLSQEIEEAVRKLIRRGCRLLLTNSQGLEFLQTAWYFPEVQFCQISSSEMVGEEFPPNFHTTNTALYQGYYVSGIAAGMKLSSLIEEKVIEEDKALVGFVGEDATPEVISRYTAFLLGVRQKAPTATLKVCYTGNVSNFSREKALARRLISEGCVVISQSTHTIGPALACEEHAQVSPVYHVAFDQGMIEVAPNSALISIRSDWSFYCSGAVKAMLSRKPIESLVDGTVHGQDVVAGFEKNWIQVLELNEQLAVPGTWEEIGKAIEGFRRGNLKVFEGDYRGFDPVNPSDTYDLSQGYTENESFSAPSFCYQLEDVVEVLQEE